MKALIEGLGLNPKIIHGDIGAFASRSVKEAVEGLGITSSYY